MLREQLANRANSLISAAVTLIFSVVWSVFTINSISTPFDSRAVQSPLLYVVAANMALSWMISEFVRAKIESFENPDIAVVQSSAAYVFATSTAAAVTSATHLVETLDIGRIDGNNALTVVFDAVLSGGREEYYLQYCICVAVLVGLSLVLIRKGAAYFASRDYFDEIGPVVGTFSGMLMAISILVGVTWHPVPGDSSAVAETWATVILLLVGLAGIAIYGFLSFRFIQATAAIVVRVISSAMNSAVELDIRTLFHEMMVRAGVAIVRLLMFSVVLSVLLATYFVWAELTSASSSVALESAKFALKVAWVSWLWALAGSVVLMSLIALCFFCGKLKKSYDGIGSAVAQICSGLIGFLIWSVKWAGALLNYVAREVGVRRKYWLPLIIALFAAASVSNYYDPSPHVDEGGDGHGDTIGVSSGPHDLGRKSSDVESVEEVTVSVCPKPDVPVLISANIKPISFCSPTTGSLGWAYEKEDRLEFDFWDCEIPRSVQEDFDSLVAVGLATQGVDGSKERMRGYRRGNNLGRKLFNWVRSDTGVYVLNLGMLNYADSARILTALDENITETRPALVLAMRAVPVGAKLDPDSVAHFLEQHMKAEFEHPVSNSCELYLVQGESRYSSKVTHAASLECSRDEEASDE